MEAPGIVLTAAELVALTGYSQPAKQLDELRRQGFWRARRNILGLVVLERAHYDAVCHGATFVPERAPRLRLPEPGALRRRA